ncbi:MAG TPA: hypothetical protein VF765_19555 [Polyangiaceae bacterium]
MVRSLLTAAVLGAASASAACGGDAFTAGSATDDAGTAHDGSSPPMDAGSGSDVTQDVSPIDALPPVDATGEPPPSCSGNFACVPDVPAGWTGPLELYAGTAPPPVCMTGFAQSVGGFAGLQARPATCGCGCGPSTTTCDPPTMAFEDSTTCSSTPVTCASVMLMPGTCETVNEKAACLGASLLDITLLGGGQSVGDCTPQPSRTVPPYSWTDQARGCVSTVAPAQVDCGSGQICAPKPEPGFDSRLCVAHAGDVACPGGGYGVKHTFFTQVDDTRDCSACTCGPPSGGSCSFSITAYSSADQSCTGNPITYGPGTKCAGVAQPTDMRLLLFPTNGACGPSTSAPTGTATPVGAVTVCCPF